MNRGNSLTVEMVGLAGPKQGEEVFVEMKASGVCHTDAFTLSGDALQCTIMSFANYVGFGHRQYQEGGSIMLIANRFPFVPKNRFRVCF